MSSVVISGDTSGTVTVAAPAVAGSNTLTLQAATATNAINTLATAQTTTTLTSYEFLNLPSWIKRITVLFNGVSVSSTNPMKIQLGTSSGYATSGYLGASSTLGSSTVATTSYTDGFTIRGFTATDAVGGAVTLHLISGTTWIASGTVATTSGTATGTTGGNVTLAAVADRVRIYIDGTNTFDAGSINILYEG